VTDSQTDGRTDGSHIARLAYNTVAR